MQYFMYSFICQWTFGLYPSFDYYECCCCEHECTNIYLSPYFPFILSTFPGVELLYYMLTLIFWGTYILSSIVAISFYIPTWSLIFLFNMISKWKVIMKHDILFGSVLTVGNLLKELMVSVQVSQLSRAFFQNILPNKRIVQHRLYFGKSVDWH